MKSNVMPVQWNDFYEKLFTQTARADSIVKNLRCENLDDPLGVDTPNPRLSWMLEPGARGLAQSAYHLVVASEYPPGKMKILWDSGKVVSDKSSLFAYEGAPLVSGMRCRWVARIWDKNGSVSEWSEPAFFTMGPMKAEDWRGEWIGADWIKNNEGPLPLLRRIIKVDSAPAGVIAHVCALGYYELYVNGTKIGEDVLSPAVSDYSKRGLYITHDLKPFIKEGENCIGLWLGRGWSTSILGAASTTGPMVKAQVEILDTAGKTTTVATDRSWLVCPSHITPLVSKGYGGELIEAAREIPAWSSVECDVSAWRNATVHHPPTRIISAQMMETNRLLDVIAPVSVMPVDGGWLVDMGRNYTGWFELRMPENIAPGTRVDFEYADKRYTDSTLPDGGFQTYNQRDTYVAGGGGGECFRNRFNYHAFRWAIIKGLTRAPGLDEITGRLISTNYRSAATFESDNSLLNNIYNTVIWTHRCLSIGGYTVDCPHRERLGYGGDSGTFMESTMLNFHMGPFYAKWAADWRDAQIENGDLPFTAPHPLDAGGGPAWSGFCITMPWQVYVSYGDRRVLELGWPVIRKWLAFIETKMKDGLLAPYIGVGSSSPEWNFLGDWVPPGRKQGGNRVDDTSTLFFNNCYLVHCLRLASKIGNVLAQQKEAEHYAGQADALAGRLHKRFFNDDAETYANGEQTYLVMPQLFDITPDAHKDKVMAALEKDIVEIKQGHLNTGMHGTFYMARLLIRRRRNDLMTMMMTKETFPGYGYMLKNGATTIWEEWDGDNSHIHNTMVSIGMWFIAGLGGIQADEKEPGFKHFIVAPGVESGLTHVAATCVTGYGKISSVWKRDGKMLVLDLEVPPNSSATVILPAAEQDAVMENNGPPDQQTGVSNVDFKDGLFKCDVMSGTYRFSAELSGH